MKNPLFYSIIVLFVIGILTWWGATADIFHPPAPRAPQQQEPITKVPARQKKKNCHCCKQTMAKLKQVITDNFADKGAEKQTDVVSRKD